MSRLVNGGAVKDFVTWFRDSAPYIRAHRGRTFVIFIEGAVVASAELKDLIHDIALLNTLGVRQVLVHGLRVQINKKLGQTEEESDKLRITDAATLEYVKEIAGIQRLEIEALLSMGVANSPMAGAGIRVVCGNFIVAKPLGIRNGIDYQYTGEVRRVDVEAIRTRLQQQEIALISPLGYSPTGEIFNLAAEDLACTVACALQADKIILLHHEAPLCVKGALLRELSPSQAEDLFLSTTPDLAISSILKRCLQTASHCCRQGIHRAHLINAKNGGLLLELFTRDGIGTLITSERYESLRQASIEDIGGILELIEPLEAKGVLARRSRSQLETEIEFFCVIERDGMITACAALYPFPKEKAGELACLAVHPAYRSKGRGDKLLKYMETSARSQDLRHLFVLTTRTEHWFIERGFCVEALELLPIDRRAAYNYRRNSKMLLKSVGRV